VDAIVVRDMLNTVHDRLEYAVAELADLLVKVFKHEWLDCLAWYRAHVETVNGVYHEHRDLERSGLLLWRQSNMADGLRAFSSI
jgi:hypothetical protein